MHAEAPTPAPWSRLSELIAARTGLHFPPERHADLQRAVVAAAPEFGFTNDRACAEWLLSARLSSADLRTLATHLTIGETYFFRERPSFNAIANEVLPVLTHRRRAGNKRLRIWSAACSTGEEAYSLAILVQQTLPDWQDWNINILATDINPMFLRKAEAGIYGEWSFRESGPDFRPALLHAGGRAPLPHPRGGARARHVRRAQSRAGRLSRPSPPTRTRWISSCAATCSFISRPRTRAS